MVGFGLTHYGSFKESPAETKDFWWYFLLANVINHNMYTLKMNFISIEMMLRYFKNGLIDKDQISKWWDIGQTLALVFNVSRMLIDNVFPYLVLFTDMENENKKYFSAVNVITSSFNLMLTISQIPGAGVFLHMMKRVSVSMLRFFASYFWHFLGYAIAFHIIMPDEGAFKNVSDSIIKVLTSSESLFYVPYSLRPSLFTILFFLEKGLMYPFVGLLGCQLSVFPSQISQSC